MVLADARRAGGAREPARLTVAAWGVLWEGLIAEAAREGKTVPERCRERRPGGLAAPRPERLLADILDVGSP
ncbi:hypothetical protein GCM10020227_06110 [Streptomyces flavovirens]